MSALSAPSRDSSAAQAAREAQREAQREAVRAAERAAREAMNKAKAAVQASLEKMQAVEVNNPNTVATKTLAQTPSAPVTPEPQAPAQPTTITVLVDPDSFTATDGTYQREEFSAQLNAIHPEPFTSAEDVTTTLANMGIEADPALAAPCTPTGPER